jgi:hypothetical protein
MVLNYVYTCDFLNNRDCEPAEFPLPFPIQTLQCTRVRSNSREYLIPIQMKNKVLF